MSQAGTRRIPVVVVCPPRTLLLDVAGPVEVLRKANLVQSRVAFDVAHVGPLARVTSSVGLTLAELAPLPDPLPEGALVILSGTAEEVLGADAPVTPAEREAQARIVAWLRRAVRPGHRLVSICSGALLAARAGLLDGHACTTHHACCAELAALAPAARVLEDRLYVEDGERFTSAGIAAGIDLMLHLVTRLVDPACAVAVARYLVVYLRRAGADPQVSPWLDGRNHLHPAIHRVQDAVSAEPARAWTLEALADLAGTSPRHLSRLFNRHAGMGLPAYVNGLRVALARDLLAQTRLDMERVAERAGFASPRQLRRAWARVHDRPPSRLRGAAR
ncbi:HTH-type transcriptional activator RhaR [Methylobacterium crusticola]|uniref:HTH-type transcriptional activator RhaR n=1 Tax=Methylobacterium crusticola TaxID=1697972 RepID=A0ABQ4QY97_9HYPH|nr:helix-turn-helix domain-containing protein [Methylobacterium crusticola]GJD50189.1 HTH-type transcriptional activator RhaR [Methylobacterium crusticola]